MQKRKPLSDNAGELARGILKGKTFVLRNVFYWLGKVYVEAIGREITWARERISVEEDARARNISLIKCTLCGSLHRLDQEYCTISTNV